MTADSSMPPARSARVFSGLGISAVGVSVLAFVLCWFPFFGILGIPIAAIALIVGIAGYFFARSRGESTVALPVVGIVIAILAMAAYLFFVRGFEKELRRPSPNQPEQSMPHPTR
jgi:hypothetical protein